MKATKTFTHAGAERVLSRLYAERRTRGELRLERVVEYAKSAACRTALLLEYFDEASGAPCGRCDGCAERAGRVVRRKRRSPGVAAPRAAKEKAPQRE